MIQQKVEKKKRLVLMIIPSTVSQNYGTKYDGVIKKISYVWE